MLHHLLNKRQAKEDMIAFIEANEGLFPDLAKVAISKVKPDDWRAA
jgi:hypothetical protein